MSNRIKRRRFSNVTGTVIQTRTRLTYNEDVSSFSLIRGFFDVLFQNTGYL